jgi:general stress protein 26
MKTYPQNTPALNQLCQLIENMSVAMLTTANAQGQLISRPTAPLEMDRGGALWFFTDLRYAEVEHLRQLNLTFSNMDKSTYVSICGRGEIYEDQRRIDALWTAFMRPWFRDGRTSHDLGLLRVLPDAAEYWDAPHSTMVRLLTSTALGGHEPDGIDHRGALSDLTRARNELHASRPAASRTRTETNGSRPVGYTRPQEFDAWTDVGAGHVGTR